MEKKKKANSVAAAHPSGSPCGQRFQQHLQRSSWNDTCTAPSDHAITTEEGWDGSRTDIMPDSSLDVYQEQ